MTTPNLSTFFQFSLKLNIHDSLITTQAYKKLMKFPRTTWVSSTNTNLPYLAYDLYQDYDSWMALALYNNIVDPLVLPPKIYFIPQSELYAILDL